MLTEQPKEGKPEAVANVEPVKEALTRIEAERIDVPDYVPREFVSRYREFVEHYGKELADYFFQDKIEMKKLAEFYGSKLKKHYSFPMLENSLTNKIRFAQAIDHEGCICIAFQRQKRKNAVRHCLNP